ncbi:hypothetical protein BSKO_03064 [Bryopsis sp. KO-2023]|nr:hypothetical protein BSKO_03064 [Bryopsis sp. KO-2023]
MGASRELCFLFVCAALLLGGVSARDKSRLFVEKGEEKKTGQCVCVFDFDETLRVQNSTGWSVGSKDSREIVNKCRDLGYEVALASANCDTPKMKFVLPNHIDDDIFTDAWFESPAFQNCDPWKTNELNKLMDHFKTPAECMMFFDDLKYNVEKHATEVGVHWVHVDPEHGVTWDDFWALHPYLEQTCDCIPRKV